MWVEQAVFTSARTRKVQGYHLVARSGGVDEEQVKALTRWCPSHGSLAAAESNAESVNFHSLTRNTYAISRTVYGGPEYSARGGLQVLTRVLVVQTRQLDGYDQNPLTLARLAKALGLLRFELEFPEDLEAVELPTHGVTETEIRPRNPQWGELGGEVNRVVSNGGQACVVGLDAPQDFVAMLLARTPKHRRLDLSFATALKPSLNRPFQLTCVPELSTKQHRQLESEKVRVLQAQRVAARV